MSGYDASVLSDPRTRLLVMGLNWLGDGVMSMPALQVLRDQLHPDAHLDLCIKPGQQALWTMHRAPGRLHLLEGTRATAARLRGQGYTHAILLPNSLRSALVPALARIPFRRGAPGHQRRLLLHDPVSLEACAQRHQQWEMAALLLPHPPETLPPPQLTPPAAAVERAAQWRSNCSAPCLALIPGAERGPSKRWLPERFREVAQGWVTHTGGSLLWLGTPADRPLCEDLARDLPGRVLAGETNLGEFAALLAAVEVVLANDSGGMHLAAALGTPLVAVFGTTDPARTGPLGSDCRVLQHASRVSRRVPRDCPVARAALAAVSTREVLDSLLAIHARRG